MKLYKFRSLEQVEFTLDILLNEKLYCSPYEELNDPFEGLFKSVVNMGGEFGALSFGSSTFGGGGNPVKITQKVSDLIVSDKSRVCSLSASEKDVRLWSHYANGHKGIAIEIDIEVENSELYEVDYIEELEELGNTILTGPKSDDILKTKSKHWDYEQEYRVITSNEFFSIEGKITRVLFGLRTPELMKQMLSNIIVGRIPIYSTRLNEKTIEIERCL